VVSRSGGFYCARIKRNIYEVLAKITNRVGCGSVHDDGGGEHSLQISSVKN
jgi:hypothetical protein